MQKNKKNKDMLTSQYLSLPCMHILFYSYCNIKSNMGYHGSDTFNPHQFFTMKYSEIEAVSCLIIPWQSIIALPPSQNKKFLP